jgi:ATP synthase protein I
MVRPIFSGFADAAGGCRVCRRVIMTDKQGPSPDLSDIDARLRAARKATGDGEGDGPRNAGPANMSGLGVAMRIGVELVTTVLVGVGIGWALDSWLGTAPWLMVAFILVGGAAGVMNAYRVVKGLDDSVGLGQAMERKARRDAADADR